jgi:hypothetical protein
VSNRLSIGMTPKTVRLPKNGEMLLSVHGSPLRVYKEENLAAIQGTYLILLFFLIIKASFSIILLTDNLLPPQSESGNGSEDATC